MNSDFVVFRSETGSIRAVPTIAGKGVPEEHKMRKDDTFGVVIDQVASPEIAIWKAALTYHEEAFNALDEMLNFYLEKIDWDRDSLDAERVDEALESLKRFRLEQLRGCESIGLEAAKAWQSDDEATESVELPREEVPGQMSLLGDEPLSLETVQANPTDEPC